MIHPETQKVIDYPNTKGKKIALEHFNWQSLDKVQECMLAAQVIALAKKIDGVT
jgi:hypothetical protein